MKRVLLGIGLALVLASSVLADANLRIEDAGLNGYHGIPAPIRVLVRNPFPQPQSIRVRISFHLKYPFAARKAVTADVRLDGGEQRELELPVLMDPGTTEITADASAAGTVFGHDTEEESLRDAALIVLMCATENTCKAVQSQIQFSGTMEERVDKNRQLSFEVVKDPREHWWAYSAANTIVVAMAMAQFTPVQRDALEGFLHRGGRLILVDHEVADPKFLADYLDGTAPRNGVRVGMGTLLRVSEVGSSELGDAFAGFSLPAIMVRLRGVVVDGGQNSWLRSRFATEFDFPRLSWILSWLVAYTLIVGAVNFAVLRRLHRLEFGWISVCAVALLFSTGFYYSSASRRPRGFRLDNLATYYLDTKSSLASADYYLRVSAPVRRDIAVSVADPAVFTSTAPIGNEPNSQIWSEMNSQNTQASREPEVRIGPPGQVELPLLKWSFQDVNLEGLRQFPGTVRFVAPNRLRNDTGQRFSEAVYIDHGSNKVYALPVLGPGEEIQLDSITPTPFRVDDQRAQILAGVNADYRKLNVKELLQIGVLGFSPQGQVFAGFSDGPALPVDLDVSHQENTRSLIVVSMGQP